MDEKSGQELAVLEGPSQGLLHWVVPLVASCVAATALVQLARLRGRGSSSWTTQKAVHVLAACGGCARLLASLLQVSRAAEELCHLSQLAMAACMASFWADLPAPWARTSRWRLLVAFVAALTAASWLRLSWDDVADEAEGAALLGTAVALAYHVMMATLPHLPRIADLRVMSAVLAGSSALKGVALLLRYAQRPEVSLSLELAPTGCVLYYYRRLPPRVEAATPEGSEVQPLLATDDPTLVAL